MSKLAPAIDSSDHVLGPDDAAVTLVEYGDYECPFCGRAQPTVRDALRRLRGDIRFVFRHFPLAQAHPHALPAAMAAEAAGVQGHFWPMHDMLFENQNALEDDDLLGYAEELDLDLNRFVEDFENEDHLHKIRSNFRSGVRSGVNGTPTFFVDGYRFDGSWADGGLVRSLIAVVAARKSDQAAYLMDHR